ncbi:MAG TPA: chorismate synthase, partial [Anaerolineae bacterium]|nr:chorismate synthase [Anaerolineae bacterium]
MRFLTAGESHGPRLTAIVEGLPAGLAVDVEGINRDLARRQRGYGRGERMGIEQDRVEILGGVIAGRTTGAPVALSIENRDWVHWRDRWAAGDLPRMSVPRPGHADYAGMVKYGLDDARPVAERASARETAARVAVGALAKQLLATFGVAVGSIVTEIGGIVAAVPDLSPEALWALAEASDVGCPDEEAAGRMRAAIDGAREAGDSLGGVFVVTATGVPVGLGSHVHWDRRLDACLAAAVMSIPAVKGVEIGPAFENARRRGTQVQDEFERITDHAFRIPARSTNRAGGIEGGMSNGQPIVLRAAMKPIPTVLAPLRSVDLVTGEEASARYERADVCAVP